MLAFCAFALNSRYDVKKSRALCCSRIVKFFTSLTPQIGTSNAGCTFVRGWIDLKLRKMIYIFPQLNPVHLCGKGSRKLY